ncbi:MAG: SIMPL domain-containing protein [Dehalococcoidia bacterium]
MKTKLTLMPIALLAIALAALAVVACGSTGSAEVRVEKGLAALAGSASLTDRQQQSTGVGAPAAQTSAADAATADKEKALRSEYALGSYPVTSMISSRGGESLLVSPQFQAAAGITVQGYGRATTAASSARVQFVVSKSGDIYPEPLPGETRAMPEGSVESETPPSTPPEIVPTPVPPSPITEADLAPLISAIKAQGISDADIQVTIYPAAYYDPWGPQSARVTATLGDPANTVGPLVDAGTQAVNDSGTLYLQYVGVLYTVDDCSALLLEARRAAVEDARDNGAGLAQALGVNLGQVVAASEYVYSPYGPSPCEPSFDTYYPQPYGYEGMTYDPAMPAEVQIVVNVSVTFAIG